jgi:hypothetical protein
MGGEMHDRINPAQQRRKLRAVGNISFDQLEAFGKFCVTCDKVVVNDGFVAPALQGVCGMTADVSRSSNNENDQLRLPRAAVCLPVPLDSSRRGSRPESGAGRNGLSKKKAPTLAGVRFFLE